MRQFLSRNRLEIFYFIYLLMTVSVFVRMIPRYTGSNQIWVIGLLTAYLVLMISEPFLSPRVSAYAYIYFPVQLIIIVVLLFIPAADSPHDYFINLVIPLAGQATWSLAERKARNWVIVFCMYCAVTMIGYYRDLEGVSFALTYMTGCVIISVLTGLTRRADRAREQSQTLLAELQAANQKLQDYSRQVEALAAAEERNRLARELHDSVSQTVFSMTLTAQAARILIERDPQRVPGLLDHLQELAQSAMSEMRAQIQHLRPHSLTENGLGAALRRHAAERQAQDGLTVTVQIEGERRLPVEVEEGLFRTVQEALNNVVKHARTDHAWVTVNMGDGAVDLLVEDRGAGFTPAAARTLPGHVGLSSMEERVRGLGGTLEIESAPGGGTRVRVRDVKAAFVVETTLKESEHAG